MQRRLGGDGMGGGGGGSLSQMLLDDDRAALAAAMEKAAREAGIENIRFFTQKNLYARRILDRMGLRAAGTRHGGDAPDGTPEGAGRAQVLEERSSSCATRCATSSNATCCFTPGARRRSSARNC